MSALYKVFIIDDEWTIAKGLEKLIDWASMDCMTVCFANSLAAYESAMHDAPDIIVADIKMPYLDGLELIGKLRAADIRSEAIMISGYSEFDDAKKGIQLGVNAYISKPVEQEEIKAAIRQSIDHIKKQSAVRHELAKLKRLYDTATEFGIHSHLPEASDQANRPAHDLVDHVMQYIDLHYAENISLQTIAEQFYLNPIYLSQLFHKRTGHTYISYLTRKRIEKARELLLKKDIKVYEVCHLVGYENVNHFSKVFEKIVGVNPSSYKDIIRNR